GIWLRFAFELFYIYTIDESVGKKKKRKGKSKSTNGGQFTGLSVKQNVRYEPKTTGNSSKKDNLFISNSFSALNDEEEDDEEDVQNVYGESTNLFLNTKAGGSSSFMAAAEGDSSNSTSWTSDDHTHDDDSDDGADQTGRYDVHVGN
ncbi:hypothetical protein Tco_1025250, partial [Tanacetum coccineum]